MKNIPFKLLFLGLLFAACDSQETYQFQISDLEPHIDTLSSDYFEGRMPFSEGEKKDSRLSPAGVSRNWPRTW